MEFTVDSPEVKQLKMQGQRRFGFFLLLTAFTMFVLRVITKGHPSTWPIGKNWVEFWGGNWAELEEKVVMERLLKAKKEFALKGDVNIDEDSIVFFHGDARDKDLEPKGPETYDAREKRAQENKNPPVKVEDETLGQVIDSEKSELVCDEEEEIIEGDPLDGYEGTRESGP